MVGKSQQPGFVVDSHFEFIIKKQGAEKAGVFFEIWSRSQPQGRAPPTVRIDLPHSSDLINTILRCIPRD